MTHKNILLAYISHHKLFFGVGLYFLFSVLLKISTSIDICIPCVWKYIFGINCFGCGLTTAFISLLQFDFEAAWNTNWKIYVILPASLVFLGMDIRKFQIKHSKTSS